MSDSENEKLRQKALREAELKKEDDRTRHADYVTRIRDRTADAEVIENYTWKAYPGKGTEMLASFVEAKAIHFFIGKSFIIIEG